MHNYWAQWNFQELLSMHGVEQEDYYEKEEVDVGYEEKYPENCCHKCYGLGCKYCLL